MLSELGCGHSLIRATVEIMGQCIRGGIIIVLALVMGCSDDDGGGGPPGRGTAKCNQWQSALCQWMGKCVMPGNEVCEQLKGISCKSDPEAERCASVLGTASCGEVPPSCDLRDIADTAPAKKACEDLSAAVCEKSEQCQSGSRDACLQQIRANLPCAEFIGFTLAYERCMTEIPSIACTSTSMFPDVCKGVLLR
jgi:hypothetical protein